MSALPNEQGCIPNIGPRGRRVRRVGGAVWLGIGIAALAVLAVSGASTAAAAVLFVPFTLAALGYFQAREHT